MNKTEAPIDVARIAGNEDIGNDEAFLFVASRNSYQWKGERKMNCSKSNPLNVVLAKGLRFPIHAKLIGANGGSAEVLFESAEVCHTLSFHPPIKFPCEWILTDSDEKTITVTQTATDADELLDRVQNRWN